MATRSDREIQQHLTFHITYAILVSVFTRISAETADTFIHMKPRSRFNKLHPAPRDICIQFVLLATKASVSFQH